MPETKRIGGNWLTSKESASLCAEEKSGKGVRSVAARKLDNSEIGKTIAALRKSRGMTQQNLADKVYEGMPTISKIEKGHRPNLSVDLLQRIAEALDVTMNDLCYAATESPSLAQEERDPIIREATALISTLSPEDKNAMLRMLRGLSQHI